MCNSLHSYIKAVCSARLLTSLFGLALLATGRNVALAKEPPTKQFDANRAYNYLIKVCRIGPRISGTRGMVEQQNLIVEHFPKFGAQVRFQSFDVTHPQTGGPVRMNNTIVSWHPNSKRRVLLACHYDTRPFPDRDPDLLKRRDRFIGANDGASGVALFMELAHHMQSLKPTYGVDFVFFDGEELVYGKNDQYCLGSKYFAEQYRTRPPPHRYVYGVVVDMVADKHLNIHKEKNSLKFAPKLTHSIWATARRLKASAFVPGRAKYDVNDDHIPLNKIAHIPTCDLIDFDYPFWHTTRDTPSACSGSSLVQVARVLFQWLSNVPRPVDR